MLSTKEIFNKITIHYCGIELKKIFSLKKYGEFLCEIFDSDESHISALALHTGSMLYHVMAISVSALACLFYNNTDMEELIESLNVDDILLVDNERVKYKGIIDGRQLGVGFQRGVKYFEIERRNGGKNRYTLSKAKSLNISIYRGNADNLGGRGIKSSFEHRKRFISLFYDNSKKIEVSTEINNSVAIVADRELSKQIYNNIVFKHNNKNYHLSDLVTAAYYSENDCYQIGSNISKEEPILKFYSKVSACRDDIISDRKKRIIGCVFADESLWVNNSEIGDIADRKSIKFVTLEGRTHYTQYNEWFQNKDYRFFAIVPELRDFFKIDNEHNFQIQDFKHELNAFSSRNITEDSIRGYFDCDSIEELKRRIIRIKREFSAGEDKESFLINAYFILNICRSAFFPLCYYDKAFENHILTWSLKEKINDIKKFALSSIAGFKGDVELIANVLQKTVEKLYNKNPKGEVILEKIKSKKVDCIITTKAYYENLFSLWMNDCCVNPLNKPNIITVSAFKKGMQTFDNVVFTTCYYDFSFNPFAEFGFRNASVLKYDFENNQCRYLIYLVTQGKNIIKNNNYLSYEINEPFIEIPDEQFDKDEEFESEMDKIAKELQLKNAYRYISPANSSNDGTAKIAKIFTFASGAVGFFTKHYKGYVVKGSEVDDVELENIRVGDSIVFTRETENKDIVDVFLKQLLDNQYKNTEYPELYSISLKWKEKMKKYISDHEYTYNDISDALKKLGCEKHQVTIRSWLCEETHIVGPREPSDYVAIVSLLGLEDDPSVIKNACDKIRSMRMKILSLLGKAIIKGMFTDKKDDELLSFIAARADKLSQIEQVSSINYTQENTFAPIYMINKPCNM